MVVSEQKVPGKSLLLARILADPKVREIQLSRKSRVVKNCQIAAPRVKQLELYGWETMSTCIG
jgi:hypothetical protein